MASWPTSSHPRHRAGNRSPLAATVLTAAAVGAAMFATPLEPTSAAFNASAMSSAMVSVQSACVGQLAGYASGMIPADAALRWSFSGALPLTEATLHLDVASAPRLTPTATGLLQCDPADLSAEADVAGSLTLVPGVVGSGLTANTPTSLDSTFTLLFWASTVPGLAGELASLATDDGVLVVSLAADGAVQVAAPGSVSAEPAAVVPGPVLTDGAAHLVAVTGADGSIELTVDGVVAGSQSTSWPESSSSTLTVGARLGATSAGALIDEVTLIDSAMSPAALLELVAADRWWTPKP